MHEFLPITTERLLLRRLQATDLPRFAASRADPELARYQGWQPMDLAQAGAFVADMQQVPALAEEVWLQIAMATRPDDVLVGDIGLCLHAGGVAEIGFTLMRDAQGRGLATEALRALIGALFARPQVRELIAITDARNHASMRLLERLGMQRQRSEAALFKGEPCTEHHYRLGPPLAVQSRP